MRTPTVKVMFPISPISRAWIMAIIRPFLLALGVMMGIASLFLTAQVILRAPFLPSPTGVLSIWCALFPETLAMLAPAALLLAVVISSRHWVDSGDMSALAASGQGGRVLVPPTMLFGVLLAGLVALCTQVWAPAGRTIAREILIDAAHNMYLRPGPMTQVGDIWVRVGAYGEDGFEDVTIIGEEWIAWAPKATQIEHGSLQLNDGRARDLEQEWSMHFEAASVTLHSHGLSEHNFERGYLQMQDRIALLEGKGKSAFRERLTLYKRATLPLIVPILGVVGLPLGFRWRKPYLTTVVVILLVWALQRLGDHGAGQWGPELMAVIPFVFVLSLVALLYARWSER